MGAPTVVRTVTCPTCQGESVYAPINPARPFCSMRCKNIDLGAWASENFRMQTHSEVIDSPLAESKSQ